jgi:hypothetical protein
MPVLTLPENMPKLVAFSKRYGGDCRRTFHDKAALDFTTNHGHIMATNGKVAVRQALPEQDQPMDPELRLLVGLKHWKPGKNQVAVFFTISEEYSAAVPSVVTSNCGSCVITLEKSNQFPELVSLVKDLLPGSLPNLGIDPACFAIVGKYFGQFGMYFTGDSGAILCLPEGEAMAGNILNHDRFAVIAGRKVKQ